jgi:hypothetical protein
MSDSQFNPAKPFKTRDGRAVEVLTFTRDGKIGGRVAGVNYRDNTCTIWLADGRCADYDDERLDLVNDVSPAENFDTLKKGDKIVAEFEIESRNLPWEEWITCSLKSIGSVKIPKSAILEVRRAHHSVEVGCKVKAAGTKLGPATEAIVLCIDGDEAWLRFPDGLRKADRLDYLERID